MLEGRVIVITGSTSGVGFGAAKLALAQGAKVFIHGPTDDAVAAASAQLGGVPGLGIDLVRADAGKAIIEAALDAHGRIDAVVNNAGIFPRSTLEQTTVEFFDHMFAVNARAPLLVAQRAVEAFKAQGKGGSIVNIGSVNAYMGAPNLTAYSMSKGALMTMTRNMSRAFYMDLIRVNQLNLGWILTETEKRTQESEGRPPDWFETLPPEAVPTGRMLDPGDVAKHILFWADDASAPVTGQVYEITQTPFLGHG
jgi:NAD(P)-dependent dehydrogenase (short-subunit alcohol dehydrogenase family)